MKQNVTQSAGRLLVGVAMAVLMAACADDAPLGPQTRNEFPARLSIGVCENVAAPADTRESFHTYASGVQIYRWNGTAWSFVGPEATLYADATMQGKVGSHYGGPTWESPSGSKVIASVIDRCTADGNAIPWLLLGAVSSGGPGVFDGVSHIRRVNTVGGLAPANAGSFVGEVVRVPYTAEYFFYTAR